MDSYPPLQPMNSPAPKGKRPRHVHAVGNWVAVRIPLWGRGWHLAQIIEVYLPSSGFEANPILYRIELPSPSNKDLLVRRTIRDHDIRALQAGDIPGALASL